jgi:hypothetical protein
VKTTHRDGLRLLRGDLIATAAGIVAVRKIGPTEIQRIAICKADLATAMVAKDEPSDLNVIPAVLHPHIGVSIAGTIEEPSGDSIGGNNALVVRLQEPYRLADVV